MSDILRPLTISPKELQEKRERGDDFLLLDVREPEEYQLANLGGTLIPLDELPRRLTELGDQEREIVVMCHHGMRSAAAANLMARAGYSRVYNLSGGIDRWAREVDPKVPTY